MRAVVCYKWIMDEADISVKENGDLDCSKSRCVLSDYDLNAIEEAVQLIEGCAGVAIGLTVESGCQVKDSKKPALSRGLNEGWYVTDELLAKTDSSSVATVLAAAISKIGDVDIAFLGEGSADDYSQQMGGLIAARLGWPVIPNVVSVEVSDGVLKARRAVEEGIHIVECPLPVVVTVQGGCNTPRVPGLKQIMGAGKLPFEALSLSDLGLSGEDVAPLTERVSERGVVPERKRIVLKGETAEISKEIVRNLVQEGVLA